MYKISAKNNLVWQISGSNFTSRDYKTIVSKRQKLEVTEGVYTPSEGLISLEEYDCMLRDFVASIDSNSRWVITTVDNEYKMVLDGKEQSATTWYSRYLENLHHIAFEHTLKERYLDV